MDGLYCPKSLGGSKCAALLSVEWIKPQVVSSVARRGRLDIGSPWEFNNSINSRRFLSNFIRLLPAFNKG